MSSAARGFVALALLGSGCFAPIIHPAEIPSAMDQQMTSAAVARCVEALELPALDPRTAYAVRVAAPTGVDGALIRARLEQRLSDARIRVRSDPSPRAPTLLAVVSYAGVDAEATLIGVPFVVPGVPVALGDISLYKSTTMTGRARIELSAWNANQVQVAATPPTGVSRYYRNVTVLTFIGPFRFTDLEERPLPGEEP